MAKRPDVLVIMTDTQTTRMVGAYGLGAARTPYLDALAASGLRCDRAYTSCPLCTPARSALFSGLRAPCNGAWANNLAPGSDLALMGEIFRAHGYRAAYTGKWHLDGGGYFGDGIPGGGFEGDWWYDGARYAADLGPEAFAAYKRSRDPATLARHGLDRSAGLWGHRVADRALDFLHGLDEDEDFCLVVSFDEPHGPSRHPQGCELDMATVPEAPNFGHRPEREPALHALQRRERGWDRAARSWAEARAEHAALWSCNHWIDSQIGRVLDALAACGRREVIVVYTSDHGEQQGEHGLHGKGPMMYEESIRIPLLVRLPDDPGGRSSDALVSHLDLLPSLLELCGLPVPPILQGVSQAPVWRGECRDLREAVHVDFTRFAVNHDGWGGWQPIRCTVTRDWKLAVHLEDDDQLFHLADDPHELHNRIGDEACRPQRDALHDRMLAEMDRIRDPFRGWRWANRPWRGRIREPFYGGGTRRDRPVGFPWRGRPLEAE